MKKNYKKWYHVEERKNIMSKRYSGKSFKDSSIMKKSKLSLLEKRKLKREKKKKRQIYKMIDEHGEEEDEKTKRDLEIWKKYH